MYPGTYEGKWWSPEYIQCDKTVADTAIINKTRQYIHKGSALWASREEEPPSPQFNLDYHTYRVKYTW